VVFQGAVVVSWWKAGETLTFVRSGVPTGHKR